MPHGDPHNLGPLLDRSRTGEPDARNALLEKLRPYLKALIRSWLGTDLARQLVDSDVVQESLLRIHQNFEQFRGQTVPELIGWVRRIAFHAACDRKRQLGQPGPDGAHRLQNEPDRQPSPPEAVEREEEAVRLAVALERLPEARREVLRARLFEGASHAEISGRLGKSERAVRILFCRAVQQVRQILEAEA
jgi:RNA polymerase sigma-70 factor (ECF subfamily)